jgi:hypothetical protein
MKQWRGGNMQKIEPRPDIEQLRKLIDESADGEIEVRPNGDVVRLDSTEILAKNYQFEKGRNDLLRKELDRLREFIANIHKMTERP